MRSVLGVGWMKKETLNMPEAQLVTGVNECMWLHVFRILHLLSQKCSHLLMNFCEDDEREVKNSAFTFWGLKFH